MLGDGGRGGEGGLRIGGDNNEAWSGQMVARRVEGDGGEAGSGETAARQGRGRRPRGGGDEGEKREWGIGGGSRGEGIRPRGGLGENSFNSSVGSKNALLLKSIVVALFLEGLYYYT